MDYCYYFVKWDDVERIYDRIKIDEKEALELMKIYNHYLDERKKIMKNTQF